MLKLAMTNWNSREPHRIIETNLFEPPPVRNSDYSGIHMVPTHGIVCHHVRWLVGWDPSEWLNIALGRSAKLGFVLPWGKGSRTLAGAVYGVTEWAGTPPTKWSLMNIAVIQSSEPSAVIILCRSWTFICTAFRTCSWKCLNITDLVSNLGLPILSASKDQNQIWSDDWWERPFR